MKSPIITERSFFTLLLVLVCADRLIQLFTYNFRYTGNDEVVFWQGAFHYSNGFFHEPYMFGQNYNYMLEAFIATPLISIGIPYYISFPIVTSILALLPFMFIGVILYKRKMYFASFVFIGILLFMPIEYGILTSITRGFVSGIFFLSLLAYPLIYPDRFSSFIFYSLAAGLGFIFNPNSVLVSLPVGIHLFITNYKRIDFYIVTSLLLSFCYLIEYYSKQFYIGHPEYLVHQMWELEWSFEKFANSFAQLDKLFWGLSPIFWFLRWIGLLAIAVISVLLFKKNKAYSISIAVTLMFIIFMFGLNKVHDSVSSIFLSSSRMFLTLPLLLAISVFWLSKYYPLKLNSKRLLSFSIFVLLFFIFKICLYNSVISYHIGKEDFGPIAVKKISDLEKECNQIYQIAESENVELIVYAPDWEIKVTEIEFYNYGCNCLLNKNIPSILAKFERRYWVFKEYSSRKTGKILFYGNIYLNKIDVKNLNCTISKKSKHLFIIQNNQNTLYELMTKLNSALLRN